MENNFEVRLIKNADAQSVLEIYKPYVLNTSITFEYDVPTIEDFTNRIETITSEYPWLVCLQNDKIIGYAYGCKHRYRSAYQWSPESTIYLSAHVHGKGIGRILYETLFAILRLQGYFNVYAGVCLPNEKSEEFHLALGFEVIGDFKKVGFKMGKWHDTKWFQLHLSEHVINPAIPKTIIELQTSKELHAILAIANERVKVLNQ